MKNFIKRALVSIMFVSGLSLVVGPALSLQHVQAQSKADICEGIGLTTGTKGNDCADPSGSPSLDKTIARVINVLSLVVGIISVIMVIIGGLKYILSGGDSNQVNSAKNTILTAVVGLVIVALAQVLVRFVINRVTAP